MCDTKLTNHLLIPVLYLRCLFRALRNILTFQSISFSSPLPTWIIPTQCFNAKYICLLYQSPPTSYANELAWYLLKACDSETIHFLWDEKIHCTEKKKTKHPTPLVHYLTKTQRWLSPELYSLSTTKSATCNRTGWAQKAGLCPRLQHACCALRLCNYRCKRKRMLPCNFI